MNLESLCADARVRAAFQPYLHRGLALARDPSAAGTVPPDDDCVPRDELRPAVSQPSRGVECAIGAFGMESCRRSAFGRVYQNVLAQSQTLAYVDTFMLLAVAAAVMFALSFLVRKNNVGGGPVVME